MLATRIPAKPTIYKGIHFRSRLEATWAVWFDAMGMTWTYEPQHDLPITYQPDFKLHNGWLYLEVKPGAPDESAGPHTLTHPDLPRWREFTTLSKERLGIVFGPPTVWIEGQVLATPPLVFVFSPGKPYVRQFLAHCQAPVGAGHTVLTNCDCPSESLRQAALAVRNHTYEDAA